VDIVRELRGFRPPVIWRAIWDIFGLNGSTARSTSDNADGGAKASHG
jgi:hypothetical protein